MKIWDILNIFFVLGVLTFVMYGLLYILKKYLYSFNGETGKRGNIKLLKTQAIAPKKFVSMVKVGKKVYLLGISDQSVNLIDKLEEDDVEIFEEEVPERKNFMELLKENMGIKK